MRDYSDLIRRGNEATDYDVAPSGTHARSLVRELVSALENAVAERDRASEDLSKVTRVDVVPDVQHSLPLRRPEYWADSWQASLQDDGHTLKLFGAGDGEPVQRHLDGLLSSS